MPRILVTYFSLTGNTKKVAEAIYKALDGDKKIEPIDKIESLESYDLVFIGFPVMAHSVPLRVGEFLKKNPGSQADRPLLHPRLFDGRMACSAGHRVCGDPGFQSQNPRNVLLPGQSPAGRAGLAQ